MAKRRATRQADDSGSDVGSHPRRRRLNQDEDSSDSADVRNTSTTNSTLSSMIAKLVRLALAAEFARMPIRRADVGAKVLGENGARQFRAVFDGAQKELQGKFGMQMMELPSREKEKLGMTQRRAAHASQKSQSASPKSWVLISILPPPYKDSTTILQPPKAPSLQSESTYIALYSFVISLILLNAGAIPEAKLERYLKRTNTDSWTPIGQTEKVLQRMVKEGYLVRTRDTSSGEEIIEYSVGPRGKVEIGATGVAGLVKQVYQGSEIEDEELGKRLERSLGLISSSRTDVDETEQATEAPAEEVEAPRRRGRPRKNGGSDDDD